MAEYLGDGIYRISAAQRIWSVRKKRLDGAVPASPDSPAANAAFGWLRGTALPEPPDHGCYVVEFLPDNKVKVLAYIDWFGRAFTTSEATAQPPARQENLFFTLDPANDQGSIYVRTEDGGKIAVASLAKHGSGKSSKYDLASAGYDFGARCDGLHYFDMMARAYLAFVYAPNVLGTPLPLTDAAILTMLHTEPLADALKDIRNRAEAIRDETALKLSPTIALLVQWLEEADLDDLLAHPATAANLNLVRTIHSADIFFIRIKDEGDPRPPRLVLWSLEGALNRFLHLSKRFGLDASPTLAQCQEADRAFIEGFASHEPRLDVFEKFPQGTPDGHWETRLRISAGIENLAAPYRLETRFRYDHATDETLFDFLAPSAPMFADPSTDTAGASDGLTPEQEAQRYAMHAGLYYAVVAFNASPRMQRARVIGRPISESVDFAAADQADDATERPWFDVTFTRDAFVASSGWVEERLGNPTAAYDAAATANVRTSVPPFDGLDPLLESWEERTTLEELEAPSGAEVARAWAAPIRKDTTIEFNVEHRIAGRTIADILARSTDTAQAIKAIQDSRETLPTRLDGRPSEPSFIRLMEAVAQGSVDPHDGEAVALCFQGEDPCREAYFQAQELEKADNKAQAVKVLADVLARLDEEGTYRDDADTVFRVFDDYGSRLAFNLLRAGRMESPGIPFDFDGTEVQLAPDSMYLSLISLVELLEDTFDGSEDAIRYGKAAVALGPTVGLGYRLLARAYMLIGDFDSAIGTLQQALRVMQSFNDIAAAYYQLAYVLWQAGKPELGILCYAKAILESGDSTLDEAAIKELQQLRDETDTELPDPGNVNELLEEAGIIVAPAPEMRDEILVAGIAAMDEGLLPAARGLFSIVTGSYTSDDTLVGVVRSLFP